MGVQSARSIDFSLNAVALECYIDNFTQNVNQEIGKVDAFCYEGPRNVVGSYTWDWDMSGPWDGASGTLDDTVWGLLGSTGQTGIFQPTGSTGAGSTPEYTGAGILQSYSIKASVGNSITHQTKILGNSALTRDAT